MSVVRVGTRGSDLALWQSNWVCQRLRESHPSVECEQIVISTHGDLSPDQPIDASWPAGAFVAAVEQALLEGRVDLAVHSYKDLPTVLTDGLAIAATPERGAVHDVLLTRAPMGLGDLPTGARIGTSSPRRAAQIKRIGDFEIVPIRGNVPTRVAKLAKERLDGVILAAAGLERLGIDHPYRTELPVDRFTPAPAQGALAVQSRKHTPMSDMVAVLDHGPTRLAVTAERQLLRVISAGCQTPVGASATVGAGAVSLHGQLFSDDHSRMAEGVEVGRDPVAVGTALAHRLMDELLT
jgi:hydroxymethylbilane synthase